MPIFLEIFEVFLNADLMLTLVKMDEFKDVLTNPHRLAIKGKEITLKSRNVSNQYRKAVNLCSSLTFLQD